MLKSFRIECADWACYFDTSRQLIPTKGCRISKTHLMNVSSVLSKIRMLFRGLMSLRTPMWTSCLRYWADLLQITLWNALLKVTDHMKCAIVQLALAKQHKELWLLVCVQICFLMCTSLQLSHYRTGQNLYCLWITHRFALRLHKRYQ